MAIIAAGYVAQTFYFRPKQWRAEHRREAVELLSAAKTPEDLKDAVGNLGAFIAFTNRSWIAIRYHDLHDMPLVLSLAVARDSDGRWFECERHFCGILKHASQYWVGEMEMRKEFPDSFTNRPTSASGNSMPKMEELIPLFAATNLDAARRQLLGIRFREF